MNTCTQVNFQGVTVDILDYCTSRYRTMTSLYPTHAESTGLDKKDYEEELFYHAMQQDEAKIQLRDAVHTYIDTIYQPYFRAFTLKPVGVMDSILRHPTTKDFCRMARVYNKRSYIGVFQVLSDWDKDHEDIGLSLLRRELETSILQKQELLGHPCIGSKVYLWNVYLWGEYLKTEIQNDSFDPNLIRKKLLELSATIAYMDLMTTM